MPNSMPVVFKRTLIAVAVLSISACSSLPQLPSVDLGGVGDGIVKAGKATASVSRKTWNTTTYLLGFTDSKDGNDAASPSDEQLLTAESDINQVLPLADAPALETDELLTGVDNPVLVEQATVSTLATLEPVEKAVVADQQTVVANAVSPQSDEDLIHEVAATETLWDIAKATTGDANNWHVLADVNNLTQSASVFPGQKLTIPANMVKPDYETPVAAAATPLMTDSQSENGSTDEQLELADSSRLAIPVDTAEETEQLAQTASDAAQQIEEKAAQLAAASLDATPYDLDIGETLWDFSKRTTGDALNWQAIADHNSFSEKQAVTVRPGQTIYVPQSLLDTNSTESASAPADDVVIPLGQEVADVKPLSAVTTDPAATTAVEQTVAAALPALTEVQSPTITISDELPAEPSILDETQPIQIVEATYKTDDALSAESTDVEPVQMVENDNIPANIMVSGTYYPKAVYNNADFSSSLLMRVSPGTTLQVSKAMGTWFEVETEKGVGYVHQRDIK